MHALVYINPFWGSSEVLHLKRVYMT